MTILRKCGKCGEEKPITLFGKNNQRKDGKHTQCKECVRIISAKKYYASKKGKTIDIGKEGPAENLSLDVVNKILRDGASGFKNSLLATTRPDVVSRYRYAHVPNEVVLKKDIREIVKCVESSIRRKCWIKLVDIDIVEDEYQYTYSLHIQNQERKLTELVDLFS